MGRGENTSAVNVDVGIMWNILATAGDSMREIFENDGGRGVLTTGIALASKK